MCFVLAMFCDLFVHDNVRRVQAHIMAFFSVILTITRRECIFCLYLRRFVCCFAASIARVTSAARRSEMLDFARKRRRALGHPAASAVRNNSTKRLFVVFVLQ